jgi:hypothetical protein
MPPHHMEPRFTANLCATPPDVGKVFDRLSPLASALRLCSSAAPKGVRYNAPTFLRSLGAWTVAIEAPMVAASKSERNTS